MKTKRSTIWSGKVMLALMLSLALLAAACGSDAESSDADDTGDDSDATSSESLEGLTFTGTFMESPYGEAALVEEAGFEAATGVDATLLGAPWDVNNQNNITDLVTGTGEFDLISGEFWIGSVWDRMKPLTELADSSDLESRYVASSWASGPSAFFGGERVGVPYSLDGYGIVYRTDLFEAAGVSADWSTWDEYFAAMDQLAAHADETGATWSPSVHSWGDTGQVSSMWLGFYDGYLVNTDGEYAVEPEKATAALDEVNRLLDYNPDGALALSIDEANAVFLGGDAATLIGWPSFIRTSAQDPDASSIVDNWAVGAYPGPGFPFISSWNFFISGDASDEEAKAAWSYLEYFTDYERSKQRFYDFGIVPPQTEFFEDPDILAEFAHDLPQTRANVARGKTVPWVFEAFEVLFRNVGEYLQGNMSSAETIDIVSEEWLDIDVPAPLVESAADQGLQQQ